MKIVDFDPVRVASIECLEAGPRRTGARRVRIDVELVRVDSMPENIDGLVVTGDLQAREIDASRNCGRLFGCAVADELARLIDRGQLDTGPNIGALLCGDLYSVPESDRRGGLGDVSDVWRSFANNFSWVAGVLGNHDLPGNGTRLPDDIERAHLLDGDIADIDGFRIGGVSGIAGKLNKPNRKDPDTFISLLDRVVTQGCDVALMHESPSCFGVRRGSHDIREYLELAGNVYGDDTPLVFSGHTYWENPFVEMAGGVQVLNVDHRIFVLAPQTGR